jgi:thiol-disulfide isomerase/thioredoxin
MKHYHIFKFLIPVAILCFAIGDGYCQAPYKYKISFTDTTFESKKFHIGLYEGYQTVPLIINSRKEIVGSNISLLKYPVLEIFYISTQSKPAVYRFFLTSQSSEIKIKYDAFTDSITIQKTKGVLNYNDAGKNKFDLFAVKELEKRDKYLEKYSKELSNGDDNAMKQFDAYCLAVDKKSIEFIKNNPHLLYSLRLFIDEIIGPNYSFEYLTHIYSKYLKPRYKNTFEGKYIANKLDVNRLAINSQAPSQDIVFKDLSGKNHTIQSFKGRPLLINIWATWCVPCVEELPKLKELYTKYKKELEFVSISPESDTTKLKKFIKDKKMDWTNVGNRVDICNIYGQDKGIPQVYLLDKNGTIMYSRAKFEDSELNKLEEILNNIFPAK